MPAILVLILRALGRRALLRLFVALGDELVERTDNQLDDQLWWPIRAILTGDNRQA
jgi:hypothetical protein